MSCGGVVWCDVRTPIMRICTTHPSSTAHTHARDFKCVKLEDNIFETQYTELWRITKQKPIEIQVNRRKWNWIGHTLHKEAGAIEKTALDWNPQVYRRRGRLKRMW